VPDIFDSLPAAPSAGGGDIFDSLAPSAPKGDIFDQITPTTPAAPAAPSGPSANDMMAAAMGRPGGQAVVSPPAPAGPSVMSDVGTQLKQIPTQAKAAFARAGAGLANMADRLALSGLGAEDDADKAIQIEQYDPTSNPDAVALRQSAKQAEATLQPAQTAIGSAIGATGNIAAQTAPTLVAGAVGGPAGAMAVGGAQMAGSTYDTVYQRRLEQTGSPVEAGKSAQLAGTGGGIVGVATGGLVGGGGGEVVKPLLNRAIGAGVEGVAYGTVQSAANETITSAATGDPANYWRVPQEGGVAGAINVGITLLGAALTKGKAKLLPQFQQRVRQAKTPAEVQAVVDEARGLTSLDDGRPPSDVFGGKTPEGETLDGLTAGQANPDSFDQIAPTMEAQPKLTGDIFDQLAATPTPAGTNVEAGTTPQEQTPAQAGPPQATPQPPPANSALPTESTPTNLSGDVVPNESGNRPDATQAQPQGGGPAPLAGEVADGSPRPQAGGAAGASSDAAAAGSGEIQSANVGIEGAENSPDVSTGTTGAGSRNQLPSPGTPAVGAGQSVPPQAKAVKPRPSRTPFSKAAIERKLIEMHEAQGGAYSAQDETELGRMGAGIKSATTFYGKLPGEVKQYIESNPAAKRLFTVSDDTKLAHGADVMAEMGDKYWGMIDRVTGSHITGVKKALRKSSDPATKFWLAFHDTILPPKDRPAQVGVDPQLLQAGQSFKVNGSHFDVIEHEDGYLLLKDGEDFPLTPVDALDGQLIPVDTNTLTEAKEPEVPEGDPFAGVREEPATAASLADHPSSSSPTSDTGVFGQEIFRPATGSNQGGLFHEPVTVQGPAREVVGSKEANRPENTGEMFGASRPEQKPVEQPADTGKLEQDDQGNAGNGDSSHGESVPDEGKSQTSARKAMMAEDRKALGLDELPEATRRSWQQDLDAAREEGIPARALDIAREVTDTPRALSDVETAGIVEAAAKLKNQHAATMDEIGKLTDPLEIRLKSAEAARIQQDFDTLTTAAKLSGTEKGRALAAQKLTLNQDYQLISVKNRAKAVKGSDLSAKESEQLEHTTAKLREAEDRLAAIEKEMADQSAQHEKSIRDFESKLAHARIVKEAGEAKTVPARVNLAERIVKRMESGADKSREALKELRGRVFSGVAPDPTVVYHLAKIAAAKIARGGYEFVKFSGEMIAEYGAKIRPHLKASWDQAVKLVGSEAVRDRALEGIKAKASEGAEVGRYVQKLARSFVADGITEREPLIDAVHAEIKAVLPDFTRDQTMDAISGYGDFKQLSKDEISVKLRDLKGQMQNLGKLRDLQAKLPPQKTGVERRVPSAEERQLIKQVNDLRRRTGIQTTDPATQLKSTLDGIKTRLANEIADLDLQISTGKRNPPKSPVPYDAEATRLKADRDAKKAQYDQIFGKPEMTDEQRVKIATAAVEKSISDLEQRIASGDIAPRKAESRTPETPELKAVRDRRDALQKRLDELRKAANPPKGAEQAKAASMQKQIDALNKKISDGDLSVRAGKPTVETEAVAKLRAQREALSAQLAKLREAALTPEQRIQQAKDRLSTQIADLTGRIASGDFSRRTPPKPAAPTSKELERMSFVRDSLRSQIDRQINAMKPKSTLARVGGVVSEPFNVARSIMTSMDFSAVLRQGGFIALGHPVRASKALAPMFHAFASEQYAHRVAKEISERPNAPLYAKSKLYLAERDGPLSSHEEGFMSRLAGRIPGVKASERAYTVFLNKLRVDSFDAMTEGLSRNGEPTLDEAKAIANYINKATGRGGLGNLETAAVPLASWFFSPRYLASRLQILAGQPFYGGSAATRRMIAGDYAKFLIGLGVVYAIGAVAGGEIEKDPRSSDFAKLKFGNTRLDPGTGLQQYIVFGSRIASGQTKSSTSGKVSSIRGKVKYGQDDASDVIKRFARSKLAPLPSTAINLASGEDAVGQEVTLGSTAANLVTPMGARDVYQALRDQGVEKGTAIGLLNLFGMGASTYGKKEPARTTH
jgi:hypothetical protein